VIVFGDTNIEWRDFDGVTHVLVATAGSSWGYLCTVELAKYVTWGNDAKPPVEKPTAEAVVWKHDRARVKCESCLAVLDGAVVERRKIKL
jgi:hypothetical protein